MQLLRHQLSFDIDWFDKEVRDFGSYYRYTFSSSCEVTIHIRIDGVLYRYVSSMESNSSFNPIQTACIEYTNYLLQFGGMKVIYSDWYLGERWHKE